MNAMHQEDTGGCQDTVIGRGIYKAALEEIQKGLANDTEKGNENQNSAPGTLIQSDQYNYVIGKSIHQAAIEDVEEMLRLTQRDTKGDNEDKTYSVKLN